MDNRNIDEIKANIRRILQQEAREKDKLNYGGLYTGGDLLGGYGTKAGAEKNAYLKFLKEHKGQKGIRKDYVKKKAKKLTKKQLAQRKKEMSIRRKELAEIKKIQKLAEKFNLEDVIREHTGEEAKKAKAKKAKAKKAKGSNAWIAHVQAHRAENPHLSYKEAMQEARETY